MTDKYVYHFKGLPGSADENTLSPRRATLAAIRGAGVPVMESQIVVDHTELDGDGFVRLRSHNSGPVDDLAAQISSLERRALSRDSEASHLQDGDSGKDRYMLSLESRELRKQAQALKTQSAASAAHRRDSEGSCAPDERLQLIF